MGRYLHEERGQIAYATYSTLNPHHLPEGMDNNTDAQKRSRKFTPAPQQKTQYLAPESGGI